MIAFGSAPAAADVLSSARLERAIGVIYRPETERASHYFRARVSDQFDAVIHIDETRAVEPLERKVGRDTHRMTVRLLGADESKPGVRELVQATLDLVRGLGLAATISDDTRRRNRILDQWARTLDGALR